MTSSAPNNTNSSPTSEASPQPPTRIVVLATGGTIACTHDPAGALVPTLSAEDLVAPVQQRFTEGNVVIEARDLARLDSSSMVASDYDEINSAIKEALADSSVAGVVVTHGTDSLEETAMAIDIAHNDPRPVIITGAQRSADHPEADGPENLFESVVIAMDASAQGIGALIVFGHAVIPARGAMKWHTTDPLAFATNAPEEPPRPDPLPHVKFDGVRVDIVPAYPGADGSLVKAALDADAHGLVVEAMGSGNVGTAMASALEEALSAGIPVVIATRVPRGSVSQTYGGAGGGHTLARRGAIMAGCLHASQARIALAAAISAGVHPQTMFDV